MFRNIGKKIRILAIVLSALCFLAFLALGLLCLISALGEGVDETLKTAGTQGAVLSFVAAVVLAPTLLFVLSGFGVLVAAAEKQAEDTREVKEMLRHALAEGLLSDEIARKTAQAQEKVLGRLQAQAPQAAAPNGNFKAPVQRFVTEPAEEPLAADEAAQEFTPAEESTPETEQDEIAVEVVTPAETPAEVPAQAAEEPPAQPAAPVPEAKTAPKKTVTVKKATPTATAQPLRPVGHDDETF